MGVDNQIKLFMGERWEKTDTLCPKCQQGYLQHDKMAPKLDSQGYTTESTYECFQCGYKTNQL